MSRKLASIQKIWKVEPIEGADFIELVHVLGWQCVAVKDDFKVGDLCVYFEIDSFLPCTPEFEFLRSNSFKINPILGEGYRLKTKTFKKKISQGLVLPLEAFEVLKNKKSYEIGDDVTDLLGVRKWVEEERATTGGTTIGTLPDGVPHTDETRVQASPELINEFAGLKYYITTKCDGSSHSVYIDSEERFHVTGHNYEYKDDDCSSFYRYVKKNDIESKIRVWKKNQSYEINTICVQGEYCGAGIQKNRLKLQQPEWYVFTLIINGKRCGLDTLNRFVTETGLKMVMLEETGVDLPSKYPTVEALLERAEGEYPNGGKKEGIVIRPTEPVYCELIRAPLSMKVVSNKYLLKN